jgi:hypothetical protein
VAPSSSFNAARTSSLRMMILCTAPPISLSQPPPLIHSTSPPHIRTRLIHPFHPSGPCDGSILPPPNDVWQRSHSIAHTRVSLCSGPGPFGSDPSHHHPSSIQHGQMSPSALHTRCICAYTASGACGRGIPCPVGKQTASKLSACHQGSLLAWVHG